MTESLFKNFPRQLREQNRTEQSHHYSRGELIVSACLQFGMHCLSRLFSLKPWKLHHPWHQSSIPGSLLLRIGSLQSTAYLKPFLRNFFVYEKHVRYTLGWSTSSFQDLVMDFQCLFYTNHELKNRTVISVQLFFFLFREFDFVQLSNSIELNPWIEFNWVWLKFSMIGFDLLCRDVILSQSLSQHKCTLFGLSSTVIMQSGNNVKQGLYSNI